MIAKEAKKPESAKRKTGHSKERGMGEKGEVKEMGLQPDQNKM